MARFRLQISSDNLSVEAIAQTLILLATDFSEDGVAEHGVVMHQHAGVTGSYDYERPPRD